MIQLSKVISYISQSKKIHFWINFFIQLWFTALKLWWYLHLGIWDKSRVNATNMQKKNWNKIENLYKKSWKNVKWEGDN